VLIYNTLGKRRKEKVEQIRYYITLAVSSNNTIK
jgi:hypothetical protein